jgi:hypothetical protein
MPENVLYMHDLLPYITSQARILFTSDNIDAYSQKFRDYVDHALYKEEDHYKNLVNNMMHPICPRCGKPMVLRTAKKGIGTGSEFWGCPNFPECRVTKNMA